MTHEEADKEVETLFGEAFCAVGQDGTVKIFAGDALTANPNSLLGSGRTFEEAILNAICGV
jgi:hypothetical protein